MGSFSVYCAACAGPLSSGPWPLGSRRPALLERRRRRIQREIQRRRTGEDIESSEEDEEEEEEEDYGEDDGGEDETERYDPDIVDNGDWTGDLMALGYDLKTRKPERAKMYWPAEYDDLNDIVYHDASEDAGPGHEEQLRGKLYWTEGAGLESEAPLFPIHSACYQVLLRALNPVGASKDLDKAALYDAMSRANLGIRCELGVDYGPVHGNDQDWACVPGEEFSVACPLGKWDSDPDKLHLDATILAQWTEERVKVGILESRDAVAGWDLEKRQIEDPFKPISEHLLRLIIDDLPPESLLKLCQASSYVLRATRRPGFWKLYMKRQTPWFWELDDVVQQVEAHITDWKSFYLWMDYEITPRFGMGAESLSLQLANRRRIWGVATQLEPQYRASLAFQPVTEPDSELVSSSSCSYTPFVPLPPSEDGPRDMFLFRTRDEMENQPCIVQIYSSGSPPRMQLLGLGTDFRDSRRFWGADGVDSLAWHCSASIIQAGRWMVGMYLFIDQGNERDPLDSILVGVNIHLQDETGVLSCIRQGDTQTRHSGRWIDARPGHAMIGIRVHDAGSMAGCGHAGLIEVPTGGPTSAISSEEEERPLEATLLWSSRGSKLVGDDFHPLWAQKIRSRHRTNYHLLGKADHPHSALLNDLTPHDVLFWAQQEKELDKLETLSFLLRRCPQGENHILGMRAAFTKRYWEPARHAGMIADDCWDDGEVFNVGVDGPGGERIVECGVDSATHPRALMLRTNRDRVLTVGDAKTDEWVTQRVPEGEHAVGLAFATFQWLENKDVYFQLHTMIMVTRAFD